MNDIATRIANLSPEQRRLLELMLLKRAQPHADESRADESIPALPRPSESSQPAVFPLTASQRLMWFNAQRHPDLAAPPGMLALRLRGALDVAALEASLCEICVRHEVLRTTFDTREDGEPVQIVGPPRPVSLTQVDLSELPSPAREVEAERLLVQEVQRPFDLSGDLMLRAALLRLDDEEHVLLLVMHHIVSDGWSWDVLFRELQALYRASRFGRPANLPELPVQYADYAVWEQQRLQDGALQQQMEYWKKQLANTKALDVPTDHSHPHSLVEGMWQELRMPASLLQELYALCRRHSVTLFVTLVSAWATLLHRYSGQDDILILTFFANRNRAEVKGLIGMFSNSLVLRPDLSGDPSFVELLGRVRETVVDAISNGELPFETLIKEWRPTTMTWFSLREAPRYSLELDGLQVERFRINKNLARISSFLSLWMRESDDGLTARLNYHPDLFESPTVARMLGHLQTLLESVVADPEQPISKLPIKAAWRLRFKRWLRRPTERARGRLRHTVRRIRRAAS